MNFATGVEPTNETDAMPGWRRIASTASRSPCTTLNAPSGSPASASQPAISSDADGSFSLGLRMNEFPHASASGNIHIGTIAGKLNGVMPAATPSGWRSECESTPVPTASDASPFSRCAAPQANSTTSSPRCTSPRASSNVLPCSAVITRASSSALAATSSRKRNSTFERRASDCVLQARKPAVAAATARSTSAALANATRRTTAPVAGSVTSP